MLHVFIATSVATLTDSLLSSRKTRNACKGTPPALPPQPTPLQPAWSSTWPQSSAAR